MPSCYNRQAIGGVSCTSDRSNQLVVVSYKMSKTIKAVRASIKLGSIPIDVYLMPDGSYRLAGRNVTDAVNEENKSLTRFYKVKSLKDLPCVDLNLIQIKAETGESFIPIAIQDAAVYWGIAHRKGTL